MTTDPTADRSLELLRHSARVSPILRDAVDVVASEVATLRAERDQLRAALAVVRTHLDNDSTLSASVLSVRSIVQHALASVSGTCEHSWHVEGDGNYEPFVNRCEECGFEMPDLLSEGSGE